AHLAESLRSAGLVEVEHAVRGLSVKLYRAFAYASSERAHAQQTYLLATRVPVEDPYLAPRLAGRAGAIGHNTHRVLAWTPVPGVEQARSGQSRRPPLAGNHARKTRHWIGDLGARGGRGLLRQIGVVVPAMRGRGFRPNLGDRQGCA